jgi:hypothetical protein
MSPLRTQVHHRKQVDTDFKIERRRLEAIKFKARMLTDDEMKEKHGEIHEK